MDGRCWDRLARSSGLPHPTWVLNAVRRGKQGQFVSWTQVTTADGNVKLAKCLIDNGSEVNLVRKGFLQEDKAKISSTTVQQEGVSRRRLGVGEGEADLAVRLVKQSVWSAEKVKEESFSGKFYEATIQYDLFLGQLGFTLIVCRPWDIGHSFSGIRQPATNPNCIICTHTPRVFNTSKSEISFKFKKVGRNGQGNKSNSTEDRWNH